MEECVVASGNPADGFTFYGPFYDAAEANEWADLALKNEEWWILTLVNPRDVMTIGTPT